MLSCEYTNMVSNIKRLDKMCAINSALEIDVTGQVVAESLGTKMLSGVGGQVDFMKGAALSNGGKPIIALPSTSSKGHSRIVPEIMPGAAVTTTRAHVQYVVTEYGHVDLKGKSLRERARLLVSIAHPDYREKLCHQALARFGKF
ncbi:hypothetical protein MHBO_000242 [Bonamia ostreae]|uniref:Acetyl-CoA hydrolase/transferase C-terminal domain-containing protein n=1 Tax=Bonamia ostreae TaxID=126728 RepID=A0ABV2AEW2_9EUKA